MGKIEGGRGACLIDYLIAGACIVKKTRDFS